MKTDEEIRKLALDIVEGQVFGSWMVLPTETHVIGSVFMVLALSGKEYAESLARRKVVHVYEYLDKAGPRTINGYPTFMSHHELTEDDIDKLQPLLERLQKQRKEFLEG